MKAHLEWEASQEEEWKTFEGVEISSHGRIVRRSQNTHAYTPSVASHGYRPVSVNKKNYLMHCLVMRIFGQPRPDENCTIDHINRDRGDNRIENLRWATKTEQAQNRKKPRSDSTLNCPMEYRRLGQSTWNIASSRRELSVQLGISYWSITAVVNGQRGSVNGYEIRKQVLHLEGELWEEVSGVLVSNLGRLQTNRRPPYFPNPHPRT
eukprot:4792347-Prymnesium_polylepis.1